MTVGRIRGRVFSDIDVAEVDLLEKKFGRDRTSRRKKAQSV